MLKAKHLAKFRGFSFNTDDERYTDHVNRIMGSSAGEVSRERLMLVLGVCVVHQKVDWPQRFPGAHRAGRLKEREQESRDALADVQMEREELQVGRCGP